jgi:hypothetical protein
MPRAPRTSLDKAIPANLRRRFANDSAGERQLKAAWKSRTTEVRNLNRNYRDSFRALLGPEGMKEYRALKKRLAAASRSRRMREVDALLARHGVDRHRAQQLRNAHQKALARVFEDSRLLFPARNLFRCSPWVEYRAPYEGEFFLEHLTYGDTVQPREVQPRVDRSTGVIGSRVYTVVTEAGDDDHFGGTYYSAFRTTHTTLATGVLELHLEFETRALRMWGRMTDEWGWSNAQFLQRASAWIRVISAAHPDEAQYGSIMKAEGVSWGEDQRWDVIDTANGQSHDFRTATSYPKGTHLFIETGVSNETQLDTNDTSVIMTADVDLRLDRLRVRSCPF